MFVQGICYEANYELRLQFLFDGYQRGLYPWLIKISHTQHTTALYQIQIKSEG